MMPFADTAAACATEADRRRTIAATAYPPCWNPHAPRVRVYDDVLPDPLAYHAAIAGLPFGDVVVGPAVFRGIAEVARPDLALALQQRRPACVPTLTFARRSPAGQPEPNYVHTDVDMGQWTGILYLTPHPPPGDGTTFWAHRATGAMQSQARTPEEAAAEGQAWRDLGQWVPWCRVVARFNRLVWFDAAAFHSRALADNYGTDADARLIQVIFGRFTEPSPCA